MTLFFMVLLKLLMQAYRNAHSMHPNSRGDGHTTQTSCAQRVQCFKLKYCRGMVRYMVRHGHNLLRRCLSNTPWLYHLPMRPLPESGLLAKANHKASIVMKPLDFNVLSV